MFELPEAKRVRRKDLYDSLSDGSDESDSDGEGSHDSQAESALRAKLNAQLGGLLDISFTAEPTKAPRQQADEREDQSPPQTPAAANHEDERQQPEEEVFAFRLFRDEALTHTVVLTQDDDPAALGEGGFVIPSRPHSYYIAPAPSEEKASEYRSAAVSAEYVLADAGRRRWGLEKLWRVIHIGPSPGSACSSNPIPSATQDDGGAGKRKRTRLGKKHRILLRVREKAVREREEAAKKMALEKEEHLQEKKKRLNRERKLKRRQKEREKKAEAQGTMSEGGGVADDN